MTEVIKAWQCIGCGKLEAPQNCIGVCQDRRVELVYAAEHAATERELAAARARCDALARRFAFSHPREGDFERSYRALQAEARALLRSDAAA